MAGDGGEHGERTLIPALIPPGATHIHGVSALGAPLRAGDLLAVAGTMSSLLADFLVRSAPKSTITTSVVGNLPMVPLDHPFLPKLILRTLRLNCITDAYADIWAACWDERFRDDAPILPRFDERPINPVWTIDTPLRRAADRRNAQVEIDGLVALMLDIPVEDLCTIYRTQFAVLHGYDQRDYTYDANGRRVPNSILARWRRMNEPHDPTAASAADRTATHPGSGVAYVYTFPLRSTTRKPTSGASVTTSHLDKLR